MTGITIDLNVAKKLLSQLFVSVRLLKKSTTIVIPLINTFETKNDKNGKTPKIIAGIKTNTTTKINTINKITFVAVGAPPSFFIFKYRVSLSFIL